jgi:hypothetical protein
MFGHPAALQKPPPVQPVQKTCPDAQPEAPPSEPDPVEAVPLQAPTMAASAHAHASARTLRTAGVAIRAPSMASA